MFKLEKRSQIVVPLVAGSGKEPGVSVTFDPVTPAMRRRAFRAWSRKLEELGIAEVDEADADTLGDLHEMMSRELMRMALASWQGIADAGGKPLEPTPDQATRLRTVNDPERPTGTIDDVLANEEIFAACDLGFLKPEALRYSEKNASSASPNGTSARATRGNATASSRASRKVRAGAKSARTVSKRSKPKRGRMPGTS